MKKPLHKETAVLEHGLEIDPATGALAPPIHLSTTFERDPDGEYPRGYVYTRNENPNREALERSMASLEGAAGAMAFGSGMAAATALLITLSPGDHVLLPDDSYFQVRAIFEAVFTRWGLDHTVVDMSRLQEVEAALRPRTRLIWMETPSNPCLKIVDLKALAGLAQEIGAMTVCDNTWATGVLQRPLELGVEASLLSTTKYIAGHHDVLGGVVAIRAGSDLLDRLRTVQKLAGAVPSPFDCWLTLRGVQTLPLRIKAQTETAGVLARFLEGHPAVEKVFYPGLASHPGHDLAAAQMEGFGAMLSILVKGGQKEALAVTGRAEVITRATSLGGTHTLIEHRASLEGEDSPTPRNLLRISVGLEHPEDLMADLDRALKLDRTP